MNRLWIACLMLGLVVVGLAWSARHVLAGSFATHPELDSASAAEAAEILEDSLAAKNEAALETAASEAVSVLGTDHYASGMLQAGMNSGEIRDAIELVQESLTFRPWMEAELPEGFPNFTPLHAIEVKTYPEYRLAEASMKGNGEEGESDAFWPLFQHIQRNGIAMTAPVQMNYASRDPGADEATMAFLYRSTELGQAGTDPNDARIDVRTIDEHSAVSIGVRGRRSVHAVEQARQQLVTWLQEQDRYESDGPLRVMGYNSPFTPAEKQFYEVQISVRATADAVEETSQK